MKVITGVTIKTLRGEKGKEKEVSLPPGEHDLPDAFAKALIRREQAKLPSTVADEAAAPQGPRVIASTPPAGKPGRGGRQQADK